MWWQVSGTLTWRSEGVWRRGRERLVRGRSMEKEEKKKKEKKKQRRKGGDGRMG